MGSSQATGVKIWFAEIEGQYHVRPSPSYLSTCGECLKHFMSIESLSNFGFKFNFHLGQVCVLLTRLSTFAMNIFWSAVNTFFNFSRLAYV